MYFLFPRRPAAAPAPVVALLTLSFTSIPPSFLLSRWRFRRLRGLLLHVCRFGRRVIFASPLPGCSEFCWQSFHRHLHQQGHGHSLLQVLHFARAVLACSCVACRYSGGSGAGFDNNSGLICFISTFFIDTTQRLPALCFCCGHHLRSVRVCVCSRLRVRRFILQCRQQLGVLALDHARKRRDRPHLAE